PAARARARRRRARCAGRRAAPRWAGSSWRLAGSIADRELGDAAARIGEAPGQRGLLRALGPAIVEHGPRRREPDRLGLALRPDVERDRHVAGPAALDALLLGAVVELD